MTRTCLNRRTLEGVATFDTWYWWQRVSWMTWITCARLYVRHVNTVSAFCTFHTSFSLHNRVHARGYVVVFVVVIAVAGANVRSCWIFAFSETKRNVIAILNEWSTRTPTERVGQHFGIRPRAKNEARGLGVFSALRNPQFSRRVRRASAANVYLASSIYRDVEVQSLSVPGQLSVLIWPGINLRR